MTKEVSNRIHVWKKRSEFEVWSSRLSRIEGVSQIKNLQSYAFIILPPRVIDICHLQLSSCARNFQVQYVHIIFLAQGVVSDHYSLIFSDYRPIQLLTIDIISKRHYYLWRNLIQLYKMSDEFLDIWRYLVVLHKFSNQYNVRVQVLVHRSPSHLFFILNGKFLWGHTTPNSFTSQI